MIVPCWAFERNGEKICRAAIISKGTYSSLSPRCGFLGGRAYWFFAEALIPIRATTESGGLVSELKEICKNQGVLVRAFVFKAPSLGNRYLCSFEVENNSPAAGIRRWPMIVIWCNWVGNLMRAMLAWFAGIDICQVIWIISGHIAQLGLRFTDVKPLLTVIR